MVTVSDELAERFRMVATDLDGTIIRDGQTISDRTVEAFKAVEASGRHLVFVTGRSPRRLAWIAERLGHTGVAVAANGAVLYDLHTEETLRVSSLPAQVANGVVQSLREEFPGLTFATESALGLSYEPEYGPPRDDVRRAPLDELLETPSWKLLARHPELPIEEIFEKVAKVVGDRAVVTYASTAPTAPLEIATAGVSKATGLAMRCEELGVDSSEVIAFGDMPNDLPTFAWVGTSFAMANAHPEVKAHADGVTASNEEDGVAFVLEQLLTRSGARTQS